MSPNIEAGVVVSRSSPGIALFNSGSFLSSLVIRSPRSRGKISQAQPVRRSPPAISCLPCYRFVRWPLRIRRVRGEQQNENGYHRWYAGCPSVTATKTPRHVAQILPPAVNVPSTVARSSVESTTFAERRTESLVGVGRTNLIAYSAVTVHGGRSSFARFIR